MFDKLIVIIFILALWILQIKILLLMKLKKKEILIKRNATNFACEKKKLFRKTLLLLYSSFILKMFNSYNGNTKLGHKQTPGQTLFLSS